MQHQQFNQHTGHPSVGPNSAHQSSNRRPLQVGPPPPPPPQLPPAFEGINQDTPPDKLRTKTCRHWERGRCYWGNSCRFLHATAPVDINPRGASGGRRSGAPERAPRAPQPFAPAARPQREPSPSSSPKDSPTDGNGTEARSGGLPLSALSVRVGPTTVSPGVSLVSYPASEHSTPLLQGDVQPSSIRATPQKPAALMLPSPGTSGSSTHNYGHANPGRTYSHNPYGSSPIHSPGSSATSTPYVQAGSFSGSTHLVGNAAEVYGGRNGYAAGVLPSAYSDRRR